MQYINLRKDLFLERSMGFLRWLPINMADALVVTIDGIVFSAYINLGTKDSVQGDPSLSEIPISNHWVERLYVTMKVPVDNAEDPIWWQMKPPIETLQKIAQAWRQFESSLMSIIRNEVGQYWLPNSHEIEAMQDDEFLVNISILDPSSGKRTQFCTGTIMLDSPIPSFDRLLTCSRWNILSELINLHYKSDLSLVFARNAQLYLRQKEFRLSLVESCISLERAISQIAQKILSPQQIDENKATLEGDSLSAQVEEVLPIIMYEKGETGFDNSICTRAVELRNLVVHRACVNLDIIEVSKAVHEIERIVRILNERKFPKIEERIISV